MRNVFENLNFIKELSREETITLINKIQLCLYEEFSHKKKRYKSFETFNIEEISTKLKEYEYLVLNDNTRFKGKKKVIRGRLVVADRDSLITFFQKESNSNEETLFICMPISEVPNYIITNDDDWNLYYINVVF